MLFKNTIEHNTLELLRNLQAEELLSDFYLAGGTSLALQIGHRLSVVLGDISLQDWPKLILETDLNLQKIQESVITKVKAYKI
jgi:hypothetical protein